MATTNMNTSATSINVPQNGENIEVALNYEMTTEFNFGLQDIAGFKILDNGALLISFTEDSAAESGTLTITNFSDMANNSSLQDIQLNDGETLNLAKLSSSLGGASSIAMASQPSTDVEFVNLISKPQADMNVQSLDYVLVEGEIYQADFSMQDVAQAQLDDNGALIITFADDTQTIITNYSDISNVASLPAMTLADGTVIEVASLLTDLNVQQIANNVIKVEEVEVANIQEIAAIEPASGDIAQQLASIEPAAGGAPAGALGNTGANFGSEIQGGGIGNNPAVGPIAPTALQFDLPDVLDDQVLVSPAPAVAAAFAPPPAALLIVNDVFQFEDNAVNFGVAATPANATSTLTITVAGIPSGWTPDNTDPTTNNGVYDAANGTWTTTLNQGESLNSGPVFTPPLNDDGDINGLTVTVSQFDAPSNSTQISTDTFDITIDAVADPISLTANNVTGLEDNPVAVDIQTALTDLDGSEAITSVTITNVPNGFTFNNGTNNNDGTWSVNPADVPTLTVSAPANYSGTTTFGVTVVNTDTPTDDDFDPNNNTNTTQTTFDVTFTPVADAPSLVTSNPIVKEDGTIDLPFSATLQDTDGSESLSLQVSNLDTNWTITTGANNGTYDANTGVWTIALPAGQNYSGALTLTPPADSDVDMTNITITAVATESNGTTQIASNVVEVIVDAVADTPTIDAGANANVVAGQSVAINVSNAVTDTDGSESLGDVTISGVPAGYSLSAGTDNGNGTWTVTQAQLNGLQLNTPINGNGNVTLTASVTATDTPTDQENDLTDNTASNSDTVTFTVNQTTTPPTVQFGDGTAADGSAQVLEDGTVFVPITAGLSGVAPQELVSIEVSNIPSTWTIDTGANNGTYNAATGTWTITFPAGQQSYNGGLNFTPPANSDIDLTGLNVVATSRNTVNNQTETTTVSGSVVVDAVADTPTIDAGANANVAAGGSVAINVSNAVTDTDGSETLGDVTISGVPAGYSLSAGTDNGNGTWTVTQAQLNGLQLNTPINGNGNVTLTASVTATDTPTDVDFDNTNNSASNSDSVTFTVSQTTTPPTVQFGDGTAADGSAQVLEDGTVFVPITASLNGNAPQELTIEVSNIPSTWTINTGANNGTYNAATGTWTITMPAGQDYNGGLNFTPPANSDIDLTGLNVVATSRNTVNNQTETTTVAGSVVVDAVADMPTLNVNNANGIEGQSVALNISTALTDTDGSEVLSVITISGVPNGFSLNQGVNQGNGVWEVTQAQLNGLQLNTPQNFSGTVPLTVSVQSTEQVTDTDFDLTNNVATNSAVLNVAIADTADAPSLNVAGTHQVLEDGSVFVPFDASINGNNTEILTVSVTNIPAGWTITTGANNGSYDANTGTWSITMPAGQNYSGGLTFAPPADSDVDLTGLNVTATARAPQTNTSSSITEGIQIIVDAVADMPTLNAPNTLSVEEGQSIALNISNALTDTDGSETLGSVTISGVPNGYSLNVGTNQGNGVWVIDQNDLSNVSLTTPANSGGNNLSLGISVTSTETVTDDDFNLNNNTATNTATIAITVTNGNDIPVINQPATVSSLEENLGNINRIDGQLTADFGQDGPGTFCIPSGQNFSFGGAAANNQLTSGGAPVTISTVNNGTAILGQANGQWVFAFEINANGSYSFYQYLPLDHASPTDPNEIINLNFEICARDADGDMSTTTLTVNVRDTGPVANDDAVTLWSCDYRTMGNVITNHNQDGNGADALSVEGPTRLSSITYGGETFEFKGGGRAMIVDGDKGQLFIFDDGSYAYTAKGNPTAASNDSFDYSLVDGDGDISTATLDINIRVVNTTQNDAADYGYNKNGANTVIDGQSAYQTQITNGGMVFGRFIEGGKQDYDDVVAGNSGNDTIYAWEGEDTLYGYDGNDVLFGERDNNTLYGGSGADLFQIDFDKALNNNKFDTVIDFNLTEGDVLSLANVIDGSTYNAATSDVNDYVRIVLDGNDAIIQVDSFGAGNDYFNVARIESNAGLDATQLNVQDLFDQGHIDIY